MNKQILAAVIFVLTAILPNVSKAEELSFSYVTDISAANPGFAVSQWDQSSTPMTSSDPILNGIDVPVSAFFGSPNCCGIDYYYLPPPDFLGITYYGYVTFLSVGGFATGGVNSYYGGPLLYTGTGLNPVFSPGVITLEGATLTISVVPELSTWAMMAFGFAGLGFAGYRARARALAIAA